jgi:UDP-GlcNAc:undecaprenyl-phosphate GlcNAc-1-phosphate transferase
MFMGDTGSQFLGMFLAYYGIKYLWNSSDFQGEHIPAKQFCTVMVAFILPILDTTFVTITRLMKRRSPFVGGKDHTTHHLSYLGLSDSQVAFLFFGMGGFSIFLVLVINRFVESWSHYYTAIFVGYFLLLLTVCFIIKNVVDKNKIAKHEKVE